FAATTNSGPTDCSETTLIAQTETGSEEIPLKKSNISENYTEIPHEDAPRSKGRSGSRQCTVCTEDFIESEDVRILPCHHIYHKRCIDPWLLYFAGTCPLW